jgi:carnitine O-acetyltransferase
MAVRTFTQPASLNGTLASEPVKMSSEVNGSVRSEVSARDSQASFPSEARDPLGHHTNPNSRPGITFAHQDKLPKLPIPELESSCTKYLAALKPLQGPKEHNDSVHAVREFLKTDGPALQDKLKKYASGKANYIEQFCEYLHMLSICHVDTLVRAYRSANDCSTVAFRCEHALTCR